MRRPLFTTGIPQSLLSADGAVKVFDTTDYGDDGLVFAVTLDVWPWGTEVVVAENLPSIVATLGEDGEAGVAVAQLLPAQFDARQADPVMKPLRLLDRVLVRGNQQLYIANGNASCTSCFVYGYFEPVGESPHAKPYRPLQPVTPPESPFNAPVALVTLEDPDEGPLYETAHQLSSKYLDDLCLNVNVVINTESEAELGEAYVRLPGDVKLPLPQLDLATLSQPFDGQPMIAPSASENLVEVGFDARSTVETATLVAYGAILRR